jgi:hypothetical protein
LLDLFIDLYMMKYLDVLCYSIKDDRPSQTTN